MKKRVLIGIICAILALAVVFWLGPLVNTVTQETIAVIRLKNNVSQGSQITTNDLEVVNINPGAIPSGIINDVNEIVGKYAASDLHGGDYLYTGKLAGEGNDADAVLSSLDGLDGKVAISVPITFQGSVSGKLENGDVVRFYICKSGSGDFTYTPESLMYVRVITTTTSGGVDQDEIIYNDDGSYEMPATVTVLVNDSQARELAHYVNGYTMYLSLVCRGDAESAQDLLDMQDAYFAAVEEDAEETADVEETAPATDSEAEGEADGPDATTEVTDESGDIQETVSEEETADDEEAVA